MNAEANMLPTFIIAGAMRSGTTAMNSYLREHPEIVISTRKEVHFFDVNYHEGLDWYRSHFPASPGARAVGEATPNYMFSPIALDRIKEDLPDVQLIVLLRNPIDRAYSHYWHDRTRAKTDSSFEETVDAELSGERPEIKYIARGRYLDQLRNILDRFPRENLHVAFFEDMTARPAEVFSEICRFIGVDDTVTPGLVGKPVNAYVEFRSLALRRWAGRLPGLLRSVVGRLNTSTQDSYPEMSEETRKRLAAEFEQEADALAALIGRTPPWDFHQPASGPRGAHGGGTSG